jgi:hypothetical protein
MFRAYLKYREYRGRFRGTRSAREQKKSEVNDIEDVFREWQGSVAGLLFVRLQRLLRQLRCSFTDGC